MIRLSKSCIGKEEKDAVIGVLNREFLGMGQMVQKFECDLEKYFNRKVVCVANGTSALQLALEAAGVGFGDEVLVPSLTYIATFQAISATGAKPVACEVSRDSLCLCPHDVINRVNNKTKCMVIVHYAGGVGNLEELYRIANKNNIRVIEDAAHAFGGSYKGQKIGAFGDIACFSFDGIKNITSGEGGCVVTNDEEIINSVKNARLLGVEGDSEKRFANSRSWEFDVKKQGWRYHMSDIMAAIGIEQLKKLSNFSDKRRKIAIKYDEILSNIDGIEFISQNYSEIVPHIYPVIIKNIKIKEKLRENLLKKGIQTGIHYYPNHYLTFYKTMYGLKTVENVYDQIISLPLHTDLTDDDLEFIAKTLINELKIIKTNDYK